MPLDGFVVIATSYGAVSTPARSPDSKGGHRWTTTS
jgi:hypothetical protein